MTAVSGNECRREPAGPIQLIVHELRTFNFQFFAEIGVALTWLATRQLGASTPEDREADCDSDHPDWLADTPQRNLEPEPNLHPWTQCCFSFP